MKWVKAVCAGVLMALMGLSLNPAQAQGRPSLQDLFKNPQFVSATLSPNGKYLATTANVGGNMQLAVVDLDSGAAKGVVGYDKQDVVHVLWVNDNRIAYSLVDRDSDRKLSPIGLYAVDRDGSNLKTLVSPNWGAGLPQGVDEDFRSFWVERSAGASEPDSILVGVARTGYDSAVYRVNTLTTRFKEIPVDFEPRRSGIVLDSANVPRVLVTTNAERSREVIWYRDGAGSPWRQLVEQATFGAKFSVQDFDNDGKTLYVTAVTPQGRNGLYKYDFSANKLGELVASDSLVDVGSNLVMAPDSQRVLGVRMSTEPPRTQWFDPALAALQTSIDRAIPGKVNVILPGNSKAPVLISSYSSTDPGRYFLFDTVARKLRKVLTVRPWIDPEQMSEQLAYDYTARDGLPLMAYLTLPKGKVPKALPLVVLLHGGPHARDRWGYRPEVQFLAGMGYAVLQPQFRGSTGFGYDFMAKGFGQWGLAMQDDVTDGVNSLVKQGVADLKRICIMGSSYGGYAAMQGLVKDPDLYRCAVNLYGVTNLSYLTPSEIWDDPAKNYYFKVTLLDPAKQKEQLIATSPAKNADKIKAPVYMAYGEDDRIVPTVHGEDMRDALKRFGKVFVYTQLDREGHGLAEEDSRYKLYGEIAAFLKRYNPAD